MTVSVFHILRRLRCLALAVLVLSALNACARPGASHPAGTPFDPYEAENRKVHEFNRTLDGALIGPASKGYSNIIPDEIETAIGRFAFNLTIPGAIVNNVLQGNMKGATEDLYRFAVNSTVGLGGVFDPATELGMPAATEADFGETLYVWGVPDGAYQELPFLGPSTERATAGKVVDLFTNPLSYALPEPEKYYGTAASLFARIGERGRYSGSVESVLHESADSYAQLRSLYLQNRRYELGRSGEASYLNAYDDPYGDPYEDPYAQ